MSSNQYRHRKMILLRRLTCSRPRLVDGLNVSQPRSELQDCKNISTPCRRNHGILTFPAIIKLETESSVLSEGESPPRRAYFGHRHMYRIEHGKVESVIEDGTDKVVEVIPGRTTAMRA